MYFDSIYLWKESILFFKNKVWRGVTHARARQAFRSPV
jgi:hypothetical protein